MMNGSLKPQVDDCLAVYQWGADNGVSHLDIDTEMCTTNGYSNYKAREKKGTRLTVNSTTLAKLKKDTKRLIEQKQAEPAVEPVVKPIVNEYEQRFTVAVPAGKFSMKKIIGLATYLDDLGWVIKE